MIGFPSMIGGPSTGNLYSRGNQCNFGANTRSLGPRCYHMFFVFDILPNTEKPITVPMCKKMYKP